MLPGCSSGCLLSVGHDRYRVYHSLTTLGGPARGPNTTPTHVSYKGYRRPETTGALQQRYIYSCTCHSRQLYHAGSTEPHAGQGASSQRSPRGPRQQQQQVAEIRAWLASLTQLSPPGLPRLHPTALTRARSLPAVLLHSASTKLPPQRHQPFFHTHSNIYHTGKSTPALPECQYTNK